MAADVSAVTAYINARKTLTAAETVRLPTLIPFAAEELSENAYGTRYTQAVALLVLHWLTRSESAAGAISSEREGDLSRSYAVNIKTNELESTAWGAELNRLTKRVVIPLLNY